MLGAPKNTSKTVIHLELNGMSNNYRVNIKVIRFKDIKNKFRKQLSKIININQQLCKEGYQGWSQKANQIFESYKKKILYELNV